MGKAVHPIIPAFHGNMRIESFFNEQLRISSVKALTPQMLKFYPTPPKLLGGHPNSYVWCFCLLLAQV